MRMTIFWHVCTHFGKYLVHPNYNYNRLSIINIIVDQRWRCSGRSRVSYLDWIVELILCSMDSWANTNIVSKLGVSTARPRRPDRNAKLKFDQNQHVTTRLHLILVCIMLQNVSPLLLISISFDILVLKTGMAKLWEWRRIILVLIVINNGIRINEHCNKL